MFHRVKSEDQDRQNSSVSGQNEKPQGAEAHDSVEVSGVNSEDVQNTAEIETNPTEKSLTSQQEISQEKDTETMTEQDNTTPGQEESVPTGMSPYQRPGQSPVRAAGGYPGAYPGGAGGSSSEASSSDRRLTIGPGITMSGEIESCDYLQVEGTVEAALKGANLLEITESGVFYGTVEISEANISGRFEGDITVNGRLTITSTGTVTGSISYKEIEIEAGAVLDGKLTPLSAVQAAPAKKPSAATKAAKPVAAPKVEKQPEPANSDEGLFSKAAAAAE